MGKQYPKRVVRTMIVSIVAFSLLIGGLSAVIQVFMEYKAGRADLEAAFLDGKRDAEGAIALALWVHDFKQLNNLVRAIATHRDFTEVSILEGDRILVKTGRSTDPDTTLKRVYPIQYSYRGDVRHIGDISISADMSGIYARLFGQAQMILLWTIVQTFLVAIFVFFIFYQLMTRHVHAIAGYLEALDPEDMGMPMRLERKPSPPEHRDELDMLVSAFNELRGRLKASHGMLEASREELAVSERRYRAILEDMVDTYYRTDPDGRIVMVSPSAQTLLGYSTEEMTGKPLTDLYAEREGRDRFLASFRETGGLLQGYEEKLRRKDGRLVWVSTTARMIRDETGVFVGVEGIARDITAQRIAAEAIRDSERQLRLVADSLPALIIYVDRTMHFRFANKEAALWYGTEPEDVLKMDIHKVLDEAATKRLQPRWDAVFRGEMQVFSEVFTYPDGKERHVELRLVPHKREDGTVEGFFSLGIDVSERRMLEERLRQSQKMEALGQLTGGVAHDFNNLLGVILGNVELLLEEPDLKTEEREDLLQAIARVGARGAGLTRQLLAFSRRQPLRQEPTRLDMDLSEFAALLRRTLGETITLSIRHGSDLWRCLVDRPLLENALLNLALNARDAMPGGGQLSIVTRNADLKDPFAASDLDLVPGDYVSIAVSDNGVGMPREVLAHAFEPFYTTKDVGAGTGLGLSMVYGFARQSGGGVSLSSVEGEGTTVMLYLPRLDDDAVIETDSVSAQQIPVSAEQILVVEDDADMRRIAAESLERLGYSVTVAADGPEAIAILERGAEFDLLLTDIRLPNGMPGADVARRARSLSPTLSVVFMTGYAETSRVGAAELGENAILLRKPFRRVELARALNRALLRDLDARGGV